MVALCCLVAGCGASDSPPPSFGSQSAPTSSTPAEASRLSEPDCDDDGACQSGFVFDGAFYGYACAGVRTEFITGDTLASGDVGGRSISISEIGGIDPGLMVAVDFSANQCFRDRDDEGESGWSVAFKEGADTRQLTQAICEVGEGRTALRDCPDAQLDD